MPELPNTVEINLDGKSLAVPRGLTILEVAQQNNVSIPTLCAYKGLTPHGGCRMCVVEVEGMRGLPTACTTPAENGMVIRTGSAPVRAARQEILQLLLTEHPSSCLLCEEGDECKEYQGTIRKVGYITGCRWCPNDEQCELQEVVRKVGITEINFPIHYRNLPVQKEDPFYDRDYNLCILCGRCVRACHELRGADVLAFTQRGRGTLIGPAYDRSHLEAGCEFCGACVSVCPTGTLADRFRKWEGKPDAEVTSTCALCGVGCQTQLLIKDGEVVGSLPADDPLVNNGQLCVKGRYCVAELVTSYQRLKKHSKKQDGGELLISRDEAIELAAEKLSACRPEEFGMLISPNCSNEDLYIAQKFVRTVMGSHNIDTSARIFYGPAFEEYLNLMKRAVPLSDLQKASTILSIGLDTRFGRSTVGVEIRKAVKNGAKLITLNTREHNLSINAEIWLKPDPGTELEVLKSLLAQTGSDKAAPKKAAGSLGEDVASAAKLLKQAGSVVILVGPHVLVAGNSPEILQAISQLAANLGAGILALPAQNNLVGSVLMGVYPELLPGGFSSADSKRIDNLRQKWGAEIPRFSGGWNGESVTSGAGLKVLYLVGEIPMDQRPACDFLIYQNILPASQLDADLVIPAAAFTEADGTFINGEGRLQRARKAVNPPGDAAPDWETLCLLAQKMGKIGFQFTDASEIHAEISDLVESFGRFDDVERKPTPLKLAENAIIAPKASAGAGKTTAEFPVPFDHYCC